MARLSVQLLGPLQVTRCGAPVSGFVSDKVRALLAYLAVESDRPHRRERLAGLLWPDWPEPSARANLRRALSSLRQAIGDREADPPYLHISRQTIQFNDASDAEIDVATFNHLVKTRDGDPEAINLLEEAVQLYHGPFLEGFTLADSVAMEEWIRVCRERFRRLLEDALCHLADCYEGRGEYKLGLEHARRWVELVPLEEQAHRTLMRLLARSGQRGAALAQYEICRQILAEEFGTEPTEETRQLHARIRNGHIAGDKDIERKEDASRHNLPLQLTPFIGRQALLAALRERLENPACRLLTLTGSGGSGKTRLALEVASGFVPGGTERHPQRVRFPDGVTFVPLAPLWTIDAIVPAIAQALGFSFSPGGAPLDQLLGFLRRKRILLVLDNYDHLLDGVGVVTDILTAAADVKVLATSRAALDVQGEQVYPIGGMECPPYPVIKRGDKGQGRATHDTRDAAQYSAVQLFMTAARRARPAFDPADDDLAQVARICHLVDGLPLAILLAAAWVKVLSPAEIAAEIERGYGFLEAQARDVPERQRSMRAVFDYSWSLLSDQQCDALAGLSVFRGGCTRKAAQQVTGASLHDLVTLVDRSLLERTPGGRFEIHELLRQYAAEKLVTSRTDEKEARDRHCAHYAAATQKWLEEWKGPRQQAARVEMEADLENVHAAWDWAVKREQIERLDQAIDVLGLLCYLHVRGSREWEGAFQAAEDMLTAAEARSPATSIDRLRVWAKILAWHGLSGLGFGPSAGQLVERSLEILGHPALAGQDVRLERAVALYAKGTVAFYMVDRQTARAPWEQSLALCRELGDRFWTARLLVNLGSVAVTAGSMREARLLLQEGLAIHRALGSQEDIAYALICLGIVTMHQGRDQDAERLQREAVALCQEIGDRSMLEIARRHLALTLMTSGQYSESHSLLLECVAYRESRQNDPILGHASIFLAHTKLHLGQYERARQRGDVGLAISREMGERWGIGFALLLVGRVALAEGAHAQARLVLQESADVFRESANLDFAPQALASLAQAELRLGHLDRAQECLRDALRPALEQGHGFTMVSALPVMALLLAAEGRMEQAIEMYALASRYGHVANSRWWEHVAGKRIADVAAALPPEVVVAAQERGRARDLEAAVSEMLASHFSQSESEPVAGREKSGNSS